MEVEVMERTECVNDVAGNDQSGNDADACVKRSSMDELWREWREERSVQDDGCVEHSVDSQ